MALIGRLALGEVIKFNNKKDYLQFSYAPEIDIDYPFAMRIMVDEPKSGILLSRENLEALIETMQQALRDDECES